MLRASAIFLRRTCDTIFAALRSAITTPCAARCIAWSKTLTYSFDIKEIIVSGDMAIVRLVWTSKLSQSNSGQVIETKEPGLDVFRRQPDGMWRISRYMAYEAP
jgi:ketosteroid isomerase-like protein